MALFTNFDPLIIVFDDGFGPIKLKEISHAKWRLLEPFSYKTLTGKTITVPAGFETDGASSPLRTLITSLGGHYSSAAVVHDYLYVCLNNKDPDPAAPTRFDADAILLEAMSRAKPPVNWFVRCAIWMAVRVGGGPVLKKIGVR
jgi:hypothetical protein